MALPAATRMTVEEYLAFERASKERHEYVDGEVVAMSGGSRRHDRISINLHLTLSARILRAGRCTPYTSNMRVKVAESGLYTYPDFTVACGEPSFEDDLVDTLVNPALIVEILSPSTQSYDRNEKWARYRSIPTLREYLLVEQDRIHVERYVRQDDGSWLFSETDDPAAVLDLESVGCPLTLAEIYDGVAATTRTATPESAALPDTGSTR